jgi:hypothetical protein
MRFVIPDDFDRCCETTRAAQDALRANEARSDDAQRIKRAAAEILWAKDRPRRVDYAGAVFKWLFTAHEKGVLARMRDAVDDEELQIWGPLSAGGHETSGGSGSFWVGLLIRGEPGLVLHNRIHACFGKNHALRTLDAVVDTIPTAIVAVVARDMASGRVWPLLEAALGRRQAQLRELGQMFTEESSSTPSP